MQEYLSTTSLGDLNRKAQATKAQMEQNQSTQAISSASESNNTESSVISSIRPPIGEVNQ